MAELYQENAPRQLELFAASLPTRPYCSDDLEAGLIIRPRTDALRRRYIQPNPPALRAWMVFDVDRAGASISWERANLAPPSFIAVNPKNAHAHLAYALSVPVCTTEHARQAPLRFAAAIEAGFRHGLDADRSYAGLICKNPAHADWLTLWGRHEPYELGELAEWLPKLPKPEKRAECAGLGRNVALFDGLRRWAYRARRSDDSQSPAEWRELVEARAVQINADFRAPLDFAEVKATAKSVAKWTWSNITPEGFSEWQSNAGQRRKAKQAEATKTALLDWLKGEQQ
jgi:hypothetical protein